MSTGRAPSNGGDLGRKRMRKGTKSCTECKRRKIKCIFRPNDSSSCIECQEKNAECVSQEFAARQSPLEPGGAELNERLRRVEAMLGRITEAMPQSEAGLRPKVGDSRGSEHAASAGVPMPNPGRTEQESPRSVGRPPAGDNGGQDQRSLEQIREGEVALDKDLSELQKRLASLLPTQTEFNQLQHLSYGWWLLRRHFIPDLNEPQEPIFERFFNVSIVATCHPVIIARLLLCVALCIQQLPANKRNPMASTNADLQSTMEQCFTTVTKLVTSDDDLTGSLEGIECLVLQGIYQTNAGNLRRAWLAFRKAISLVDLMGHRGVSQTTFGPVSEGGEARFKFVWYQVIRGERYLSLVLGVPSATGSRNIPVNGDLTSSLPELIYHQHLCNISGLIIARNGEDPTQWLRVTHDLDAKLDEIAKTVPQSWWSIPERLDDTLSDEAAGEFERIMCHIWHFEILALLHLPFMLRATMDRRYEYSRVSCLEACRSLIKRWVFIRERQEETLFSNLVEFQAFTSTVTLLLGLLGPNQANTAQRYLPEERYSDLKLVEKVVQVLEETQRSGKGVKLVNQSLSVIRRLLGMVNQSGTAMPLRLEIPYYGIVSIARKNIIVEGQRGLATHDGNDSITGNTQLKPHQSWTSQHNIGQRHEPPSSMWTPPTDTFSVTGIQIPSDVDVSPLFDPQDWMLDFDFNSQCAPLETPDAAGGGAEWQFRPDEIMFFDSLVDSDFNMN